MKVNSKMLPGKAKIGAAKSTIGVHLNNSIKRLNVWKRQFLEHAYCDLRATNNMAVNDFDFTVGIKDGKEQKPSMEALPRSLSPISLSTDGIKTWIGKLQHHQFKQFYWAYYKKMESIHKEHVVHRYEWHLYY